LIFLLGIAIGLMVAVPYTAMEYRGALASAEKQYYDLKDSCSSNGLYKVNVTDWGIIQ
jgi:hypothetical protein